MHFHNWVQRNYGLLRAVTDYGLYPFYAVFLAMLVYGLLRHEPWLKLMAMAYILAQLLGSFVLVRILKMTLGRARPAIPARGAASISVFPHALARPHP